MKCVQTLGRNIFHYLELELKFDQKTLGIILFSIFIYPCSYIIIYPKSSIYFNYPYNSIIIHSQKDAGFDEEVQLLSKFRPGRPSRIRRVAFEEKTLELNGENQWYYGDNQYLLKMQWFYSIPMGTSNTCIIVSL